MTRSTVTVEKSTCAVRTGAEWPERSPLIACAPALLLGEQTRRCSKFKINRELEMSRVKGFYRLTETWLGPASRPKDRIDLADIDVVEQIESLHDKIELAVLANGKVLEDAQFDRGK